MLARADSIRTLWPDFQVPFLDMTFSFRVSAVLRIFLSGLALLRACPEVTDAT